jgi:ribonuclease E
MEPDTQQPATGDGDIVVAPREAPPTPEMDRRRDEMPEKAPSEGGTGPLDDEDVDDDEIENDEADLEDEDDDLEDEDEIEEDEETDERA